MPVPLLAELAALSAAPNSSELDATVAELVARVQSNVDRSAARFVFANVGDTARNALRAVAPNEDALAAKAAAHGVQSALLTPLAAPPLWAALKAALSLDSDLTVSVAHVRDELVFRGVERLLLLAATPALLRRVFISLGGQPPHLGANVEPLGRSALIKVVLCRLFQHELPNDEIAKKRRRSGDTVSFKYNGGASDKRRKSASDESESFDNVYSDSNIGGKSATN